MKRAKLPALLQCALVVFLAGCGPDIGVRPDLNPQSFEVGKTTRTDVVNAIGLPQVITKDSGGRDHYFYERSTRLVGLCLGCGNAGNSAGAIPAVAVNSSAENARTNAIEFVFDMNGVLVADQ